MLLHFNLGYSYYSDESVRSLIAERLPATISLTVGAAVLWVMGGLGVGILSALRRHTLLDRAAMGTALVLVSAPEFWLGLIALFLFAQDIGKWKIFPGAGSYVPLTSDPWRWFTSLIMPWFVLAAGAAAVFARLMRGSLIETMDEDYIRTARAKGLTRAQRGAPGSALVDQPDRHPSRASKSARCWEARCWSKSSSTSPAWANSPTRAILNSDFSVDRRERSCWRRCS